MSEESKPPKKSKLTPAQAAVIGVVTGLACVFGPGIAAALGAPVLEVTRQTLEYGGAMMLVGSVVVAKFIPHDPEKKS